MIMLGKVFQEEINNKPPSNSTIVPEDSMVIGNTVLYGAISGECYFNGIAGERFCVRNSGAISVVEGVGDHGCEYMTGGIVLCLGSIGRNFAAGMSGGLAYIYDPNDRINNYLNTEMVNIDDLELSDINSEYNNDFKVSDNLLINDDLRIKFLIDRHIKFTSSKFGDEYFKELEK